MSQRIWMEEVVASPSLDEIRRACFAKGSLPFTLMGFDGGESILVGVVEVEVRDIEEKQDFPKCIVLTGVVRQGIANRFCFWKKKRVFDLLMTLYLEHRIISDVVMITQR